MTARSLTHTHACNRNCPGFRSCRVRPAPSALSGKTAHRVSRRISHHRIPRVASTPLSALQSTVYRLRPRCFRLRLRPPSGHTRARRRLFIGASARLVSRTIPLTTRPRPESPRNVVRRMVFIGISTAPWSMVRCVNGLHGRHVVSISYPSHPRYAPFISSSLVMFSAVPVPANADLLLLSSDVHALSCSERTFR